MSVTFRVAQVYTDADGIVFGQVPSTPELNVNNRNAFDLLSLLGYAEEGEWDPSGDAEAEDFLGRVLLALGLVDLATDDAHGLPTVQEGRTIECGRAPGYLQDRLVELRLLAEYAQSHDLLVDWC